MKGGGSLKDESYVRILLLLLSENAGEVEKGEELLDALDCFERLGVIEKLSLIKKERE